jgi:myo-inositol catabolism protein IolS
MKYRKLGRTGIEVSVVAMGCWAIAGGWTWGPQDEADSIATIHAALGAGVNFFDTAEGYGKGYSEEVLGRALKGRRHGAVIATKASRGNLAHDSVMEACEGSLQRLQTDVIDLYQIHWSSREVPISETFPALEKLR